MGEAFTAANRVLVHETVAQEFTRKFGAVMEAMTTGRGTDPDTQGGPGRSSSQAAATTSALVTAASRQGL